MTEYSVPTFLKEIPDLVKFKELRFLNRYDWIPLVMLGVLCYFAPEIPLYFELTGLSNMQSLMWGFFVPTILLTTPPLRLIRSLIYLDPDDLKQMMKVGIIGSWQYLHLVKGGTTTTIFSQDLRGRDFSKANLILLIMDSSCFPFFGLVRDLRPVPAWVKEQSSQN